MWPLCWDWVCRNPRLDTVPIPAERAASFVSLFTLWWNCAVHHVFCERNGIILVCIVESHGDFSFFFSEASLLVTDRKREEWKWSLGKVQPVGVRAFTYFHSLWHMHTNAQVEGWWLMTLYERPRGQPHYTEMDRWKARRRDREKTEMNQVTGWGCSAAVNMPEPQCCIVQKTPWK